MSGVAWVAGLIAAVGCAAASQPPGPPAARAAVLDPPFEVVELAAAGGDAGAFDLVLRKTMRTAGWDLVVDAVRVSPVDGRMRIDVVEVPPAGMVAQVLTPRDVRIDLGPLAPGRHVVEIWTRTRGGEAAVFAQAIVIVAAR